VVVSPPCVASYPTIALFVQELRRNSVVVNCEADERKRPRCQQFRPRVHKRVSGHVFHSRGKARVAPLPKRFLIARKWGDGGNAYDLKPQLKGGFSYPSVQLAHPAKLRSLRRACQLSRLRGFAIREELEGRRRSAEVGELPLTESAVELQIGSVSPRLYSRTY